MRTIALIAALALPAGASHAAGYADHPAVVAMTISPCKRVIDLIDSEGPEDITLDEAIDRHAMTGMVWGFILGFDHASGGLHRGEDTALVRLRAACAAEPETPAAVLLDRMR